jgi:branched-chain amino acid transport system substrate-binding protein
LSDRNWKHRAFLTAVAVGLAATACGSSSKAGTAVPDGTAAPTTRPVASPSTSASTSTAAEKWLLSYLGAKAGPASPSLSPVVVGFINTEGGVPAYPAASAAAKAAVDYMNAKADGIDGHPITLQDCGAASTEDLQACGTKFANESNVAFVVTGDIVTDDTAMYKALGTTIPIIQSETFTPADFAVPNAVTYSPGLVVEYLAYAKSEREVLPASAKVVVEYVNNTAGVASNGLIVSSLKSLGMTKVTSVPVPTSAQVPDVESALQSAGTGAQGLIVLGPEPICTSTEVALNSLQQKPKLIIGTDSCSDPAMTKLNDGGLPANWKLVEFAGSPLAVSPATKAFDALMSEYAAGTPPTETGASAALPTLMTVFKVANGVGPTQLRTGLLPALRAFAGPAMMQPGPMKCGWFKVTPVVCATQVATLSYANGMFTAGSINMATAG